MAVLRSNVGHMAKTCFLCCHVYRYIAQQYCVYCVLKRTRCKIKRDPPKQTHEYEKRQRHVAYVAMYIAILRSNIVCCKEPDAKIKRDPPRQTHKYEKRPMNVERDLCILLYCAAILCAFLCILE